MPTNTLVNSLHVDPAIQDQALALREQGATYPVIALTLGITGPTGTRSSANNAAMYACQQAAFRRDGNFDATCRTNRGGAWRGGAGVPAGRAALVAAAFLANDAPLSDAVTFAVEIEVSAGLSVDRANVLLRNGGFAARGWQAVYDGSVPSGCEVKPSILRGEAGLADAMAVMAALKAAGARIDRSAGLHVHVGTDGMSSAQIERVIAWSVRAQPLMNWLVAPDRRANTYCRPMTPALARTARDLLHRRTLVAGHYDQRRYVALNLCAYQFHGTLEFRQHEGTLSGARLSTWVRFIVGIMTAARAGTLRVPATYFGSVESMLAGLPIRQATADALVARATAHGCPAVGVAA